MTTTDEGWQHGFHARLEAALPIEDLMAWLLEQHPGASERDVLAMVQAVYECDYDIAPAAGTEREYRVAGEVWKACPQRVAVRAG
jgi:hypothetical protein